MNNFSRIGRHAVSVLVGQLAVVGFGVVDNAIAGHIDKTALAALSLGIAISLSIFVGLMGVVQAVLPITGQLYGAKRYTDIGYQFRQSLYLAAGVCVVGITLLLFPDPLLHLAQVDPDKEALVRNYLSTLAIGFVPSIFFRIYASLSQAISRPWFVTMLQMVGLVIKVPLAWFLAIHMDMGITGCALSTVILNTFFMIVAIGVMTRHPAYRILELFKCFNLPSWASLKDLLKLGIPMGLSYFIEVTGTTFMAILIARFHSDAFSAGHQIVAQIGSLVYMIPLSISIAGSAVAAQYIGARNLVEARAAGNCSIFMSIACASMAGLIAFTFRYQITGAFTNDADVLAVAASLVIFIAIYQIADATQVTTAFILRAYKIAILPTVLYAFSLWGIGILGGYIIAFNVTGASPQMLQGPAGFWLGNSISLGFLALALVWLYNVVSRKRIEEANALHPV